MSRKKKITERPQPTVGEIAYNLMQKDPDSRDPIELEREMQKDYLNELIACALEFSKKYVGDFYVVIITKKEKLLPNVFRNYFAARISCPTPDYDQSVFKYHYDSQLIEYIWTIPCKDACIYLKENAPYVGESERQLLQFVLQFSDGTLYKLAKQFNKEAMDSPLLTTT